MNLDFKKTDWRGVAILIWLVILFLLANLL